MLSFISNEPLKPRQYTTFANTISDLSGTEPPHSIVVEPSRTIFVMTMLVAGALLLLGTYQMSKVVRRRRFLAMMTVFGVGLIGIGVFPVDVRVFHLVRGPCCFVGGSIAAVMSRKVIAGPLRHFAWILGATALLATVAGLEAFADFGPQAFLGRGGIERWIAYPVLLWLTAFGADPMVPVRPDP